MSILNRAGNLLKQNVCKRVFSVSSASSPSLFQTKSCMSSSAATKLFVGSLSANIDAVSLMEAFSRYGSVIEARVINDHKSTTSVGFGFVTYRTSEAAYNAIQAFNGQEFQGLKIRVNFAYDEGGSYGGGGNYDDGGNYGGYGSQGGGYGRGGNQGDGNYSGGDGNYGGDVSNGDGNQFSGGGVGGYGGGNKFSGVGGYGDSVQDGGGGNYSGSKPIGFASLLKDTSGAISETRVPLGGDQG